MIRLIKAYLKQRRYDKYMKSDEWRKIKSFVKSRDDYKCFICSSTKNIEVHHWYYPKNIYDTKVYDCSVLCKVHHDKLHKKITFN